MTKKQSKTLARILISGVIYTLLLVALHTSEWFGSLPYYARVGAFAVPYLIIGYDILWKALRGIFNFQAFDENLLMSIATIAAFAIGEFAESVAVMLFYQVGELFQSYAVGRSRDSIADLMSIAPEYANLERKKPREEVFSLEDSLEPLGTAAGETYVEQVDPDDVQVGDIILIRPGEKVPLDGEIIEGDSFLDTSPLTGESVPRRAAPGQSVISGCINGQGTLRVKVTKDYDNSTVARILELVEEASEKKAKLENFITRFARYYTPVVTILALVLALVPPLLLHQPFGGWIHRACTFLIVSCPCALVISVPLGFFAGIGAASREGILIKGGNFLEAAAEASVFAFDKTGTITKGDFSVRNVVTTSDVGLKESELLFLTAAVEASSTHPVARAVVEEARRFADGGEDISGRIRIENQREISGRGIVAFATIEGLTSGEEAPRRIVVGNAALMAEEGMPIDVSHISGTVVCVGLGGKPAGILTIDDHIKEDARRAVEGLRDCGVEKLVMISGDKKEVARRIADEAGLDDCVSDLLPQDKVKALERLMAANDGLTCYVGDGINDAPVLMRADLGIAMGACGSDAAIEAADIVLMDDDLSKLPGLVRLARRVRRIVRQNIVFAIGVKFIVLACGALGLATLWAAVFADVGVAVLAILNSMRLMRRRAG